MQRNALWNIPIHVSCYTMIFPLALLIGLAIADPTDTPVITAKAIPADAQIVLDGHLNETFWQQVAGSDAFIQQEPQEGAPPTERTEVRVVYDKDYLYIGVTLHDSSPEDILGFQRRRDASLSTDDRFMWILDTYESGRKAYFFEINPAGPDGRWLAHI